jgi:hypothetical protein
MDGSHPVARPVEAYPITAPQLAALRLAAPVKAA